MTLLPVSLQAENRAEFAERTVAKLEKTIDDLEGTVVTPFTRVLPSTSLCGPDFSVSVFSFPSQSAHLCIFPTFLFLLSLSLCSPMCRRTVQSEAEIQGYQRGVGSCPQWSEHLVMLPSESSLLLRLFWSEGFCFCSSLLSILNAQ